MAKYDEIIIKIIKEQEQLMGPVAWREAAKVSGLKIIDTKSGSIVIEKSDNKAVVDDLVKQYGSLFGRAAMEVCKEAAAVLLVDLSPSEIPSSLK
jgi:hypothetical protein